MSKREKRRIDGIVRKSREGDWCESAIGGLGLPRSRGRKARDGVE